MKSRNLSIIIPFYRGENFIKRCLENIYTNITGNFEVIISSDGFDSRDFLFYIKEKFDVKVIMNPRGGFAQTCNRGAEISKGENLVFLNQDVFVGENWNEPVLYLLQKEYVGAVGIKLLYEDKKIQHAGICFNIFSEPIHIYRKKESSFISANKEREFQAVTGAVLGIRKEVFEKIKFSTDYFFSCEDLDLCLRIRKAGMKVIYTPYSYGIHLESSSEKSEHIDKIRRSALKKFIARWRKYIEKDEFKKYIEDGEFRILLKRIFTYTFRIIFSFPEYLFPTKENNAQSYLS